METPLLEAVRVSKTYPGNVRALSDVSVSVAEGETLVLVGESGCGKTTLLRLFNRLVEPSEGDLFVRGRAIHEFDPITLRRRTGYVQQEGGLLPHWTVRRNVTLVPELLGTNSGERNDRADGLLNLVGLDASDHASRYPSELSGGQRQRVAFARALAADPDVILLDEPFGALDAITRRQLQGEFLRLKRELKKTFVVVTHDLAEAFRLGDTISVMREGRILQTGSPEALRANPSDPYVRELLETGGAT